MRVRISFDALRLCLLVAAGVTSGYLWRAAFESSSPAEDRVAATPRIVEQAPSPPVVRIAPHHLTVKRPAVVRQAVSSPAVRATKQPSAALASSHVTSSPSVTPTSEPPKSPPPKPSPSPAPTPGPAPAPPPSSPTSTPTVAAPVQQVVTPPPTTTPTTAPPPPTTNGSDDGSRPGWGNGDKNHDHSGPGGKGK